MAMSRQAVSSRVAIRNNRPGVTLSVASGVAPAATGVTSPESIIRRLAENGGQRTLTVLPLYGLSDSRAQWLARNR